MSFAVAALCASLMVTGCAPDPQGESVYYVPVPDNGQGGQLPPSGDDSIPTSPSPTESGKEEESRPVAAPGWEKSCISLLEFKDTYQATLIFSVTLLKDAAKNAPDDEFRRSVRFLARELEKSEGDFSRALLEDKGATANAMAVEHCGEPLLLDYSLTPAAPEDMPFQ